MNIEERAKNDIDEMFGYLDTIDVNNIRTEGLTIRAGEKVLKLEVVSESPIPEVDEIREEFRKKLTEQLQKIKEKINTKITETSNFVSGLKREYERKERELKNRLSKSQPMPDVFMSHAQKGLSLVKGDRKDTMHWLVQGIYWPKQIDGRPLEGKFSKKMLTQIVFCIETKLNTVISVTTRKPIDMSYFNHYHQSSPDCWGNWKHPSRFETPEDIINIAREAEVVLENINTGSIADHNPRGLPRLTTVKRHILKGDDAKDEKKLDFGILNQTARRSGITGTVRNDDDMWST